MKRAAGVVLAVSSLPSPYGIGTFGQAAYDFADFTAAAGLKLWQLLPLGPTSYGDSPYQSFSTFAGNPYYIDPELLIADGLLTKEEADSLPFGTDPRHVDYGQMYESRFRMLALAKSRGWQRDREKVARFEEENASWLPDYTLFMACKRHFGMRAWMEWPEEIRLRKEPAVRKYRALLRDDIELFTYIQYLFFRQWFALRDYVHKKGVRLIGDVPIYVAMDSADVWSSPQMFELDEENKPLAVAGVPPDYFSEDGQLWGNPLYRWDRMKADGFGWWIRRIEGAGRLYDIIRIDHFRGFDTYWSVPPEAKTARPGHWCFGPGMDLIGVLNSWFPQLEFIAEDLGTPMDSVEKLLADSGWPGMKVLEFAFDIEGQSRYVPHRHIENCVCYTSTHDNVPLMGWVKDQKPEEVEYIKRYLHILPGEPFCEGMLRSGMMSVAKYFIAPLQDYLGLDEEHTMNRPGTTSGNWQWRLLPGEASPELAAKIAAQTLLYGRREGKKVIEEEAEAEEQEEKA
ncbi:MAG: 4-alpha-glucanotransferase [Lachnospiraceae bacterium]|nr:4-alpha-glucanotransferase [Lachnospiraceae bacterium]